jgi:hypothetical protein
MHHFMQIVSVIADIQDPTEHQKAFQCFERLKVILKDQAQVSVRAFHVADLIKLHDAIFMIIVDTISFHWSPIQKSTIRTFIQLSFALAL